MDSTPPSAPGPPRRIGSLTRGVMLLVMALVAVIWAGLIPPLSAPLHRLDLQLRDRLSLMLSPTVERRDLVFVGIDEDCRVQASVPEEIRRQSRALTLMRNTGGNETLDRRVFAELIERLAGSGARLIIFDVLFVGSSGRPAVDEEFARVLKKHGTRIVLAEFLQRQDDGTYRSVSSREQLPLLDTMPGTDPQVGYVNLWPDAADGVVRHMLYQTTLAELDGGAHGNGDPVHRSLAAVAGQELGAVLPAHRNPRLRFAVSRHPDSREESEPSFAAAYAPHSLLDLFVPDRWDTAYDNGAFFRDKVVLVSTAALADNDHHPIPGAVIFGGQFHLQALGCLLEDSFWVEPPRWLEMVALLVMAAVGSLVVRALRHPLAIVLATLALAGGAFVACVVVSEFVGFLFAGTPGLLGLVAVTFSGAIAKALKPLVRRTTVSG